MKPVFQTIYGHPDGNCFAACVASILEMELEDVPNFCGDYRDKWTYELNKWLLQFGLGALTVEFQDEIPIKHGYCCAGGKGPTGIMHSVVMKDMKMIHNPHEGWDAFEKGPVDYTFFVILDPVRCIQARRGYI